MELFAVGEDGALWHIWQTEPNGGWSDWTSHGTPPQPISIQIGGPAVAASADGPLELFIPGADTQLWHINHSVRAVVGVSGIHTVHLLRLLKIRT